MNKLNLKKNSNNLPVLVKLESNNSQKTRPIVFEKKKVILK